MSFTISEESEPELRDDEAICPVTNFTYFKALGHSPWVDPETGRQSY